MGPVKYRKILLPIDLSDDASWANALPTATDLCEKYGAKLEIMTVVPSMGLSVVAQFFPDNYEQEMVNQTIAGLQAVADKHVPAGLSVEIKVASGTIYREIMRTAEADGADLIVMGSHRPELADYLLGPNAARVVRHATCSVMVVRG